jgi:Methyltransferase domain
MANAGVPIVKRFVRRTLFTIPGMRQLWHRWVHGRQDHQFVGWGMTSDKIPPWQGDEDRISSDFLQAHKEMVQAVRDGSIKLTQFDYAEDKEELLRGLMWRHYVVFWSARYAAAATGDSIVECGVCDGLTIFFALRALRNERTAFCYDAWGMMLGKHLLDSERQHLGDYSYLSLENTKRNLAGLNAIFVKGYIPESFRTVKSPTGVVWLHIDLNSSLPTTDSLHEFFDNMPAGSVILFDDYAEPHFRDTKRAIDLFFADKKGILLPFPTGQAIFFKR